jgi:hypothetical protein
MMLLAWLLMMGWLSFPASPMEDYPTPPKPRVQGDMLSPPKPIREQEDLATPPKPVRVMEDELTPPKP